MKNKYLSPLQVMDIMLHIENEFPKYNYGPSYKNTIAKSINQIKKFLKRDCNVIASRK